jgi:hypothetical protein
MGSLSMLSTIALAIHLIAEIVHSDDRSTSVG